MGAIRQTLGKACLGALLSAFVLSGCRERIHVFEGVQGPAVDDTLMVPVEAGPKQFDMGSPSRLAVLITEDDSNWLALASGLKTIGVPFRMTRDLGSALTHNVVMVYPQITGLNLSPDDTAALRAHVRGGGTLIGTNVLGAAMRDVFGFESAVESKARSRMTFASGFTETADFLDKGLSSIKVGNADDTALNPATTSYGRPVSSPLATYESGEAAIVAHDFGEGRAYALGMDPGQLLSKGYNRRQVGISEAYANTYQPVLDAWLILIEAIYKAGPEPRVVLGTVPDGKSLSFMLTHDIDFSKSLRNALPYARHQSEEGLSGTYFIQTKYVLDYNDEIFFAESAGGLLQELEAYGAEIGSHSVAHSNAMWDFPTGDGSERYPEYRPYVRTADYTSGASLMGEARVSKFLLDTFLGDQEVQSFRPGYLANPDRMPQVLASTGYRYSSSVTANVALTHLPFRLSHGRGSTAFTPVFEIPITVEDELPPAMIDRLEDAKTLARQIAGIGGTYVVLTHTDAVDSRLDFQKAIVDEVRPYAWMGSIREFGQWWAARDAVAVDVQANADGTYSISLDAPKTIAGLTLEIDQRFAVISATVPLETITRTEDGLLLATLSGRQTIRVRSQAREP